MLKTPGWRAGTPIVQAQSAVAVPLTGTLTETTLATIVIPGGLIGPNGSLRITALWSMTNSANNKNLRIKLGATAFLDYTQTTTRSLQTLTAIRNRNSASSQVCHSNQSFAFSASASTPTTGTVDTSVSVSLTLTGQLSNTGENITLEGYTVEILP